MAKLQHKLRHLAISVSDVAAAQKFFEDAFGMVKAGEARSGVHMTDGIMNVALLKFRDKITVGNSNEPFYGLAHFGMWVDNMAEAEKQVLEAGAVHLEAGSAAAAPSASTASLSHEVKFRSPHGLVFDLTESGWAGAVKQVKPA